MTKPKTAYKVGSVIRCYRYLNARAEAAGDQAMYPADPSLAIQPSPMDAMMGAVTANLLGSLGKIAKGSRDPQIQGMIAKLKTLIPSVVADADWERDRELWLGAITKIVGNKDLSFPAHWTVEWFYPVRAERSYFGVGPVGFVTKYDKPIYASIWLSLGKWIGKWIGRLGSG